VQFIFNSYAAVGSIKRWQKWRNSRVRQSYHRICHTVDASNDFITLRADLIQRMWPPKTSCIHIIPPQTIAGWRLGTGYWPNKGEWLKWTPPLFRYTRILYRSYVGHIIMVLCSLLNETSQKYLIHQFWGSASSRLLQQLKRMKIFALC